MAEREGDAATAVPLPTVINVADKAAWRAALLQQASRPVLAHLNADTTWLIQLPYPAHAEEPNSLERTRFNILVDPWLQGPQSDVASWFSTQWHIIPSSVATVEELNRALAEVEGNPSKKSAEAHGDAQQAPDVAANYIDAVVISHEFTDHCHKATLLELPKSTPVFATDEAAKLIKSWKHFATVVTTPGFSASSTSWRDALADPTSSLPSWLGIGRVITAGNSLYYHSAVLIAFELGASGGLKESTGGEAIIYSPHGIQATDLQCVQGSGLEALALLHGLHDVRIKMTKQLNLGALNGIKAATTSGAKYWIATHDEVKKGGGIVSMFLRRRVYTLKDAVQAEESKLKQADNIEGKYRFLELGSGEALCLL